MTRPVGDHAPACTVHGEHRPRPWDVEVHHVWPLGMGGPDTPRNRVPICPTGHTNVHALLRHAARAGGVDEVPWDVRRRFHPGERALARIGYDASEGDPDARAALT